MNGRFSLILGLSGVLTILLGWGWWCCVVIARLIFNMNGRFSLILGLFGVLTILLGWGWWCCIVVTGLIFNMNGRFSLILGLSGVLTILLGWGWWCCVVIARLIFNMNGRFGLILGLLVVFAPSLRWLRLDFSDAISLFMGILLGLFGCCLSLLWSWLFIFAISGIWFVFDMTSLLWRRFAWAGILVFSSGLSFLLSLYSSVQDGEAGLVD